MSLKPPSVLSISLLLGLLMPLAQAESLFQAGVNYTAQPLAPSSLFARPRPRYVGDMITILVNEQTVQQTQFDYRVERGRIINDSGTNVLNNVVGGFTDKLPIGGTASNRLGNWLRLPNFNGVNDINNLNSRATSNRQNRMQETVTCQVVEVLPNGNLMVQGHKTAQMAKERTDIFVTGIVNPILLDNNNQIPSTQVANLQFLQGGNGIISRTQNDGLFNKLYQFVSP